MGRVKTKFPKGKWHLLILFLPRSHRVGFLLGGRIQEIQKRYFLVAPLCPRAQPHQCTCWDSSIQHKSAPSTTEPLHGPIGCQTAPKASRAKSDLGAAQCRIILFHDCGCSLERASASRPNSAHCRTFVGHCVCRKIALNLRSLYYKSLLRFFRFWIKGMKENIKKYQPFSFLSESWGFSIQRSRKWLGATL